VSDTEPIPLRPHVIRTSGSISQPPRPTPAPAPPVVAFNRQELNAILHVYGRKVAEGEWRDYALDFGREAAVFAVYRRASEVPLFRIEKCPKLARRQGAYAVISATGQIMKRGPELARVLAVFDSGMRLVGG
jgi:hypothetical protein